MSQRIVIASDQAKHIQAYIDYKNIVGDDDGGKVMSEKEFEEYKNKVREARKNHLYVYWRNSKDFDCKSVGPESMCFCGHRYKNHHFDNVKTKKINCKDPKCKCPLFNYIPVYGSNDVKCLCKHSYSLHNPVSKKCGKCNTCTYFGSKFTCNCTEPFDDHVTVIETREERVKAGKTVDPLWMGNNMNAAIGGLNSFTGMVNDKYMQQYQNLLSGEAMEGNMLSELKKNYLMDDNNNQESSSIKGNKINENKGESAYDLFKKPHIFSSNSGMISKQMNRLSLLK
jgi:hypothetical protein